MRRGKSSRQRLELERGVTLGHVSSCVQKVERIIEDADADLIRPEVARGSDEITSEPQFDDLQSITESSHGELTFYQVRPGVITELSSNIEYASRGNVNAHVHPENIVKTVWWNVGIYSAIRMSVSTARSEWGGEREPSDALTLPTIPENAPANKNATIASTNVLAIISAVNRLLLGRLMANASKKRFP
jgi:hypothetical protein